MSIIDAISDVRERIEKAAATAGRDAKDVKLIAVTKTVDAERINEAIRAGISAIGENKVQELAEKREKLLPVEQHLIGQLQSNKAKYVVGSVALIHSVDRISLAEEINRLAAKKGVIQDVLVQINIGDEQSKGGLDKGDVPAFLEQIEGLRSLRVRGLMAIPPICTDDEARRYFAAVRRIAESVSERRFANAAMEELSMGMSGDFEAAILEGATMVRVGSAIFGVRSYPQASV